MKDSKQTVAIRVQLNGTTVGFVNLLESLEDDIYASIEAKFEKAVEKGLITFEVSELKPKSSGLADVLGSL